LRPVSARVRLSGHATMARAVLRSCGHGATGPLRRRG